MIRAAILYLLLLFVLPVKAQQDTAYWKVVTQRAGKIVGTLGITDEAKSLRVRDIIAQQYVDINKLEDGKAADTGAVARLHAGYICKLSAELTPEQVTKVKDGMTYGVLPLTYNAYTNMLPQLTAAQKTQIMAWLVEAREHAMDAGSSEKKHAWFGKYKGRINNYLSAAGIDMKQAEADWKKRRSEKQ